MEGIKCKPKAYSLVYENSKLFYLIEFKFRKNNPQVSRILSHLCSTAW